MTIREGALVRWRLSDEVILGVVLRDLGIETFSRKYLIFWHKDSIVLECYGSDIEII